MKSEVVRGYTHSGVSQEGNEFAGTPNHSASLWGYYTLPIETIDVELVPATLASYYFDQGNTTKSDAAILLDATFAYCMAEAANLLTHVDNLTDEQHIAGSGTADY